MIHGCHELFYILAKHFIEANIAIFLFLGGVLRSTFIDDRFPRQNRILFVYIQIHNVTFIVQPFNKKNSVSNYRKLL